MANTEDENYQTLKAKQKKHLRDMVTTYKVLIFKANDLYKKTKEKKYKDFSDKILKEYNFYNSKLKSL